MIPGFRASGILPTDGVFVSCFLLLFTIFSTRVFGRLAHSRITAKYDDFVHAATLIRRIF